MTCLRAAAAGLILAMGMTAAAETITWSGTSGAWSDPGNWDLSRAPLAGDDVVITVSGASVLLSSSTPALGSLTLGRTLTFTNWNTTLTATNVAIQAGAVVGLPPAFTDVQMSNRVNIVCSSFLLASTAVIDGNQKGFVGVTGGQGRTTGYGPGAGGARGGGGHGGRGGYSTGGNEYDEVDAPIAPGSSGGPEHATTQGYSGNGGGAVRIDASGHLVLNGTIRANGGNATVYGGNAGGAGGSVFVSCHTLAATNGVITADGGTGNGTAGGGAGGRIAIVYDAPAQSNMPPMVLRLSATYTCRTIRRSRWTSPG
jgi:hypothetical protein